VTEALLTLRDVARMLNVSERTVFRLIEQGDITGIQIGGEGKGRRWRFEPSVIEAYLNRQRGKREQGDSSAQRRARATRKSNTRPVLALADEHGDYTA